ncbi:MAG: hypothetical protein Q8P22_01110, partial [Chloroflexota bacterium]|nr:hypothetical protein [Chloroflexota bacterium]
MTRMLLALALACALTPIPWPWPWPFAPSAAAAEPPPLDWDVSGGHFYTQANGRGGFGGTGYSITNDPVAPFWSEFQRLGEVPELGYPASRRFLW